MISPPGYLQTGSFLASRILLRFQRGDPRGAAEDANRLVEQLRNTPRVPALIFVNGANCLAQMAYLSEDGRLCDQAESAARMTLSVSGNSPIKRTLARKALALVAALHSDVPEAGALLAHLRESAESLPDDEKLLCPWHLEMGLLARTIGRLDEAAEHLDHAVRRPGASQFERTWASQELSQTMVRRSRAGDAKRARALTHQAQQTSQRFGFTPLEARIPAPVATPPRAGSAIGAPVDLPDNLSSRELEVLRLVARGFTNHEVGVSLFISTKTVDSHVRSILEKTGMANRTEAVAYALRRKFLE